MGKRKKKNKETEDGETKIWHVWGRAVKVHKDKKKYNRTKKHKDLPEER